MNTIDFFLYLITDRKKVPHGNLLKVIGEATSAGIRAVQLREKDLPSYELYHLAQEIKSICKTCNAKFLINDRIDIALALDTDGVHLGKRSIPLGVARRILGTHKLIGFSAHNIEEAIHAEKEGADFITISPIFPTEKEIVTEPIGIEEMKAVATLIKIPVFALGGIQLGNVEEVIRVSSSWNLSAISVANL